MEINQVVWGKITKYPWWPGIIRDIKKGVYKVEFIGDPMIAELEERQVKSFADGLCEFSKAKTKGLKLSIEYAMKISPNGVDNESLIKINEEIREKMKIKRPRIEGAFKAPKTYSKSLKSLEKLLISQIKTRPNPDFPEKKFAFSSLFPILQSLESTYSTTCAFQDLYESFYALFEDFPNIDRNTMRVLKYFSQTYEKSPVKQLEKLSSKVYDFYLFWKIRKIQKDLENQKSSIANAKLRKHVCRKLALVLQKKKIGTREAQVKALSYERQVRNKYPEMGEEYVENCKLLLKTIKTSY